MTWYRVYFVDSDNHIHRVAEIECASDEAAIESAMELDWGGYHIEIWDRSRLVRRFERRPPA